MEWAEQNRYIAAGTSPEAGKWKNERVPFMVEIMETISDPNVHDIVLMCSSQIGKSELLLNALCYFVAQEPSPILFLQPTIEAAEGFSKERIEPTFQACPALIDKFEQGKDGRGSSRKSSETIRLKKFPGGFLAMVGANSPAGLASRPIRVLLCDEVDRYGTTKEGDPLKLAEQRTLNFFNSKRIFVSTPTIRGASKIEDKFLFSDQRFFFVPCPHCGKFQELKWENVKWDKDEKNKPILDSSRLICLFCGEVIRGAGKISRELLTRGEWRAKNNSPKENCRGYSLNALYSPWVDLSRLVEEFCNCVETKNGLQEFVNLKLGESFDAANFADDWKEVQGRGELYGEFLPAEILVITAGVDVQRDRLEIVVLGWGVGFECWGIMYSTILGDPKEPTTWQKLDEFLLASWRLNDGRELPISCTCVDSGDGTLTQEVYSFTAPRAGRGVYAVKGRGGSGVPLINRPTNSNRQKAWLFVLGVNAGKGLVFSRLKTKKQGPGYVHFPLDPRLGFDEYFFKGLFSEKLEFVRAGGTKVATWVKIRERNEALDCSVYATAAVEILQPNFELLKEYKKNNSDLKIFSMKQSSQNQQNISPFSSAAGSCRRRVFSNGVQL